MSPDDLVVGRWAARFRGRFFPVSLGRSGIGQEHREGDGISPAGVHLIESVWVRTARLARAPRGAFRDGIRVIGPRDGWSDDPADPDYNCPVRRPHAYSSEALYRPGPVYDLVAVLDINRAPVVPGAGSALFVHVWRGPRRLTEGCIALRRDHLAWTLDRWRPRSRVIVRGGE